MIYDYLVNTRDDEKYRYAMVGYSLSNTMTEHGHVARGVCVINEEGYLKDINERTRIEKEKVCLIIRKMENTGCQYRRTALFP